MVSIVLYVYIELAATDLWSSMYSYIHTLYYLSMHVPESMSPVLRIELASHPQLYTEIFKMFT